MAFTIKIDKSKNHTYPKTKEEWAKWINDSERSALNERRPHEFQWAINTAYYLGFQHLLYSPLTGVIQKDIDSEEIIVNRIAPFVEQRVAKLTRTKPILTVLPDKMEKKYQNGALLNEYLIKFLWKTQGMDVKAQTHALLLTLMGSSFIKPIWNPNLGEILEKKPDEEMMDFHEDGEAVLNEIFQGDIETHVKSAWSILHSPGATGIDSCGWLIDRTHMTYQEVYDTYPDLDMDLIKCGLEMSDYEKFVHRLQSPIFSSIVGQSRSRLEQSENSKVKEHDGITVKEMWIPPNNVYDNGIIATVIGEKLVGFTDFPEGITELPFIKSDDKENPFGFYGQSTVTRLIPLQRRYNQGRTQVAKNAALTANVKWWAPKGHGMHEDALTDEEGEVIESNPNLPRPQQLAVTPLPNYIIDSMAQDIADIRDIGGEREATQLPFPNLTAGVALETAAELADTIIQPIIRGLESSFIKVGRFWLMYAQSNYQDPRVIKVTGENNQVHISEIKNTDLLHQTDITIQLESYLGYSKAAQQQKLLDMWDRRIISDPDLFIKAFVTGKTDVILRAKDGVNAMVSEDIERIKNGEAPPVLPFDDHVRYVSELSSFIQTPEFRRMPADRQMLAMQAIQQHLQFLQPTQEENQNPAAVNTPFGSQVTEGPSGQGA